MSVCFMGWHPGWRRVQAAGSRPSGRVVSIGNVDRQWIQIQVWRPAFGDAPMAGRGDRAPSGLPGPSTEDIALSEGEDQGERAPAASRAERPGGCSRTARASCSASVGSIPGQLSIAPMASCSGISGRPGAGARNRRWRAQPMPSACWSSGQAWCRSRCQYGQSCVPGP
jgi:hypothetical protein